VCSRPLLSVSFSTFSGLIDTSLTEANCVSFRSFRSRTSFSRLRCPNLRCPGRTWRSCSVLVDHPTTKLAMEGSLKKTTENEILARRHTRPKRGKKDIAYREVRGGKIREVEIVGCNPSQRWKEVKGSKDMNERISTKTCLSSPYPRVLDATTSGVRVVVGAAAGVELQPEGRIAAREHYEVQR
jgi:hypothetical protein